MQAPENFIPKPRLNPLKNKTNNPEGNFKCERCQKDIVIHPEYRSVGISTCISKGKCYDIVTMVQRMLAFRGWEFVTFESLTFGARIHFKCNNGHKSDLTWDSLKKGCNCKHCQWEDNTKPKPEIQKVIRPLCECMGGKKNPRVCPHYNFLTHGAGVDEWEYELNKADPRTINPWTTDKYWFRCPYEHCLMPYEQDPHARLSHNRCPYCAGTKVCHWNCLATNYPELCEEWHDDNTIKPTDITPGTTLSVYWKCLKNKEHEKFFTTPGARIQGTECPSCKNKGHAQLRGGHNYFVQASIEKHGMIYEYHDQYAGELIPIKIWCNAPRKRYSSDEPLEPHGYFMKTPASHKQGWGCNICSRESNDSRLIRKIKEILAYMGYFENQHYRCDISLEGLIYKKHLRVDIIFDKGNIKIVIEGDGSQHFNLPKMWGDEEVFEINKERDLIKDIYCLDNRINLIRIPYNFKYIKELLTQMFKLCEEGKHVYCSYQHYANIIFQNRDISEICSFAMPCPNKLQKQ